MENKDLQKYIQDLVKFSNAIKFFHWQTKIYSKHKALDKLYSAVLENMDEFTEIAMGKYGRIDASDVSFTFDNVSDKAVVSTIDDMIENAKNLSNVLDSENDTDLLNLRDELMGICNKTKYLLTLK